MKDGLIVFQGGRRYSSNAGKGNIIEFDTIAEIKLSKLMPLEENINS